MIVKLNYFPKKRRSSKLTFINKGSSERCTFSLDTLTKILESVISVELNACLKKDYKKNGDPFQMAYEDERGCTACNAITFTHVDINLNRNEPCVQKFVDMVKAFNMAYRGVMLSEVHRIAGAGGLCASRFDGRVYVFDGEERGHEFNRGVDAGSPIAVFLFKLNMNHDKALTALNPDLDWPSLYSDDRSALVRLCNIFGLQKALDESWSRAKILNVLYHTHGDKAPMCLACILSGMDLPEEFLNIKLGDTKLELVDDQRNLGLNIYTNNKLPGVKPLLAKWGYYFIPEVDRLKSLAYRMQETKDLFIPKFMKMMILCYFCGVMNFCSCLYWLRSRQSDVDELRFYYGMAISAVIGETAMGTLGESCCKARSVKSTNTDMKVLLEMVGLKSLEEIAITDAIATIRQVQKIRPAWFIRDSSKRSRPRVNRLGIADSTKRIREDHEAVAAESNFPKLISEEIENSNALIGDICRLAWDGLIHVSRNPPKT